MKRERVEDRLYHWLLAAALMAGLWAVGFNAIHAPALLSPPVVAAYELPAKEGEGLYETAYSTGTPLYIHLNSATAAELQGLPGIGEKLAKEIIRYREENGRFHHRKELMQVKGIGEKTYEKLKDQLLL